MEQQNIQQETQQNAQNQQPSPSPQLVPEPKIDDKSRQLCIKLAFAYAVIVIVAMILLRLGVFNATHMSSTGNAIDDLLAVSKSASLTRTVMFVAKAFVIAPLLAIFSTAKKNNIKIFQDITKTNFGRATLLLLGALAMNILFTSLGGIIGGIMSGVAGYLLKKE